jgi:mannose-6-phosphate isomerase
MKLEAHPVEKVWGMLPAHFGSRRGAPIGEIWFAAPDRRDLPLLVKYIFTREKLSVQVHPDDRQARARGLPNGKSECWYILEAEEGACLALGFKRPVSEEALRRAALDGSIEALLDWKPVRAGDFYYVPAGTVHAIGEGVSLIEIQQHSDVTYRLYDYGRPRELHLADGLAVAQRGRYPDALGTRVTAGESRILVPGPHFTLLHLCGSGFAPQLGARDRWVLPLDGAVDAGGATAGPGDCLFVPAGERLVRCGETTLLVAAAGAWRGAAAGRAPREALRRAG